MTKLKMNVLAAISISGVICAGVSLIKQFTDRHDSKKNNKDSEHFLGIADRYRQIADAIDRGDGEWAKMPAEDRKKLSRHYRLTSFDFIDRAIDSAVS